MELNISAMQYFQDIPEFKLLPTDKQIQIVKFFSHDRHYFVNVSDIAHFLIGLEEVEVFNSFSSLRAANKRKSLQRVLGYRLHFKTWKAKGAWMGAILNLNDTPDYMGAILTHMFD